MPSLHQHLSYLCLQCCRPQGWQGHQPASSSAQGGNETIKQYVPHCLTAHHEPGAFISSAVWNCFRSLASSVSCLVCRATNATMVTPERLPSDISSHLPHGQSPLKAHRAGSGLLVRPAKSHCTCCSFPKSRQTKCNKSDMVYTCTHGWNQDH